MSIPRAGCNPTLTGDPARSRLSQLGWTASSDKAFDLAIASKADSDFSVSKIWRTPAPLRRSIRTDVDTIVILMGVDGLVTVGSRGDRWDLDAGQLVIAATSAPLELEASEPSTHLEIMTTRRRLGAAQLFLLGDIERIDLSESYRRVLIALASAMLDDDVKVQDAEFGHLRNAIESALAANIIRDPGPSHTRAATSTGLEHHATLRSHAHHVIETRYRDPDFTARELARALAISPAHLHRIFKDAAVTPYQLIQQRRLKHAHRLLSTAGLSDPHIARRSGFSSARALRRALQRDAPDQE